MEKRELVKKEFGYDDAIVSLQNIIDELETKNIVMSKENESLKEQRRQAEIRASEIARKKLF
jgi:FtsZ-binding cell division protein ZapB